MRVLLTGAGGFVGSHTLRHILKATDWEVVVLDSFRHKGKTDRLVIQMRDCDPRRVRVLTHDLKAPISEQLEGQIGKIDYIFNLASESHVDRSIECPRDFIENNTALILTMLEYARKNPVKMFVQMSTDEVYGAALNSEKHKEWSVIKPSNPYSASKAAQEAICISYWRTYGIPVVITNCMNLIGELQSPEKYVPMIIKRVLGGEKVTVHGNISNIGSRYYIHCRNFADALLFIVNAKKPALYPDTEVPDRYNIVGEKELNNLEVAQMVADILGKKLDYELEDFHQQRPGHDPRYALDGTKLAKMGWKPPLTIEDSMRRTVEWTINHPEWLKED